MSNPENDPKTYDFKSPAKKLATVFKKSRDNWKSKYTQIKYRAKLLSDQVRYWKEKNAKLKLQVEELEKELKKNKG